MGSFIDAIAAVKFDVVGICRDLNVGVVVRAPRSLCAYLQARNLFAWLYGQEATGHWALAGCHALTVATGTMRTTEPTSSGTMRRCWSKRPSRPWPMLRGR